MKASRKVSSDLRQPMTTRWQSAHFLSRLTRHSRGGAPPGGKKFFGGRSQARGKEELLRSELATLSKAGGDALVVIAYAGDSGARLSSGDRRWTVSPSSSDPIGLRDEALDLPDIGAEALLLRSCSAPNVTLLTTLIRPNCMISTLRLQRPADKPFVKSEPMIHFSWALLRH